MIVIAVVIYCSGCSSKYQYYLKIDSNPQSAKIVCSTVIGETPMTLYLTEEDLEQYKISSTELDLGEPCDIVWASGAKTKTPRFYKIYDKGTVFTAQRPTDHPNAELDYQVDFRNKQLKLQDQQLQIQRQQLYEMSQPRTTNCRSDFLGNVRCSSF